VQIDGLEGLHQGMTYDLPSGQTWYALERRLVSHGWLRLKGDNDHDSPGVFVRPGLFSLVREIATISVIADHRRPAALRVDRYLRVDWNMLGL
jgi:hypothetical protein